MSGANIDSTIELNLQALRAEVRELCKLKGLPKEPQLVAVSKRFPPSFIEDALKAGQRHFGENRVEELVEKSEYFSALNLPPEKAPCWHFIGHLQSNKVSKLAKVQGLQYFHALDSLKLWEKLKAKVKTPLRCFLQINTSGEPQKSGLPFDNSKLILESARKIQKDCLALDCPHQLQGLMTMSSGAHLSANVNNNSKSDSDKSNELHLSTAESCFERLLQVKSALEETGLPPLQLSMGMSGDYSKAIEKGSDFIRIGQNIFGPRPQGV